MTDVNCTSRGPDGAVCFKIAGHSEDHMGIDARGELRRWMKG